MTGENFFSSRMVSKSNSELQEYIENKSQFQEEAVLAAILELEKRNSGGDELKKIEQEIQQRQIAEEDLVEKTNKELKITNDPNAPLLYSSKFIMIYGVLFSVLAGGILMAMNFSKLHKRKSSILVVVFSFIFVIIQCAILGSMERKISTLTVTFSFLGMYLLQFLFWKREVSPELEFRRRNVWGAVIIALGITIPVVYLVIKANEI